MGATTTTPIDVAVVGGGPAGAATALALARAGYTVTVLERSRYDAFRIGETLPPAVKRPLMELGVWDQFLATGTLESPGIVSAWGRPDPYDNDFIVNPDGPGWHVDRRGFDAMLARTAGGWGAEIKTGVTAIASVCRHSARWHLEAVARGVPVALHARILVDATGRSASPARQLAGHRIVFDRLVGLVGVIPACAASRCPDRRTLVEAVETGWWYTAPLPDGRRIAAFMTDGDLVPSSAARGQVSGIDSSTERGTPGPASGKPLSTPSRGSPPHAARSPRRRQAQVGWPLATRQRPSTRSRSKG